MSEKFFESWFRNRPVRRVRWGGYLRTARFKDSYDVDFWKLSVTVWWGRRRPNRLAVFWAREFHSDEMFPHGTSENRKGLPWYRWKLVVPDPWSKLSYWRLNLGYRIGIKVDSLVGSLCEKLKKWTRNL